MQWMDLEVVRGRRRGRWEESVFLGDPDAGSVGRCRDVGMEGRRKRIWRVRIWHRSRTRAADELTRAWSRPARHGLRLPSTLPASAGLTDSDATTCAGLGQLERDRASVTGVQGAKHDWRVRRGAGAWHSGIWATDSDQAERAGLPLPSSISSSSARPSRSPAALCTVRVVRELFYCIRLLPPPSEDRK